MAVCGARARARVADAHAISHRRSRAWPREAGPPLRSGCTAPLSSPPAAHGRGMGSHKVGRKREGEEGRGEGRGPRPDGIRSARWETPDSRGKGSCRSNPRPRPLPALGQAAMPAAVAPRSRHLISLGFGAVVGAEKVENLEDGQGRAGEDGLTVTPVRQDAHVVIERVAVAVVETLHILLDGDDVTKIVINRTAEHWVVDEDAIDVGVVVGSHDSLLEVDTLHSPELVLNAVARAGPFSPPGIHRGCIVAIRQKPHKLRPFASSRDGGLDG
eukprot:scaffold14582_cov108-Isochrysis_galbana.AAC.7